MFLTKVIHFCVIQSVDALHINDIDQDIIKSNYIQNITINFFKKLKLGKLTNIRLACVSNVVLGKEFNL